MYSEFSDVGSTVLSLNTKQLFILYFLLNTMLKNANIYWVLQISMQFATFPMTSYLLRAISSEHLRVGFH